jgi:phosphomannomutase
MDKFIFDVDGTLTPSRGAIDPSFLRFMLRFCRTNDVYLATGSDAPKTIEQIGKGLFESVVRSYNCSGNSVWEKGTNTYNNDWKLPEKPWKYLESILMYNRFMPKTGWHFDERPGLINFSVVGRKAKPDQREAYVKYDIQNKDREIIAKEFNTEFSEKYNVVAQVAGETGLDIMPIGKGKQQILKDFQTNDKIIFFGDRCEIGGNDYDIAEAVKKRNGRVYHVSGWEETQHLLEDLYS